MDAVHSGWRTVSSTHDLQDLVAEDTTADADEIHWKLFIVGVAIMAAAASLAAAAVCAFVVPQGACRLGSTFDGLVSEGYATLLVMTIPVAFATVAVNWASMKLFKHNS
mmetsp:Transcript_18159/g.54624  ORF Transcript_18159/g.54624 Transcript_18159/m.54624 type:complete len:109 (-) Transcript_18159:991-1317(-)